MVKHSDYSDLKSAEKAVKNLETRKRSRAVKIIPIPENIGVGYEIYRTNGELYGVIIEETASFYIVLPAWKKTENNLERPFFLKENFLEKFELGYFKAIDGDPSKIEKYEQNIEEEDLDDLFTGLQEED